MTPVAMVFVMVSDRLGVGLPCQPLLHLFKLSHNCGALHEGWDPEADRILVSAHVLRDNKAWGQVEHLVRCERAVEHWELLTELACEVHVGLVEVVPYSHSAAVVDAGLLHVTVNVKEACAHQCTRALVHDAEATHVVLLIGHARESLHDPICTASKDLGIKVLRTTRCCQLDAAQGQSGFGEARAPCLLRGGQVNDLRSPCQCRFPSVLHPQLRKLLGGVLRRDAGVLLPQANQEGLVKLQVHGLRRADAVGWDALRRWEA